MHGHPPNPGIHPPPLAGLDIKSFVKAALLKLGKEVMKEDVHSVLSTLGLDKNGHMTNQIKKESFAKGIWTLYNLYFGNYAEKEQANILVEHLFNIKVFSNENSDKVITKTTTSATSCVSQ